MGDHVDSGNFLLKDTEAGGKGGWVKGFELCQILLFFPLWDLLGQEHVATMVHVMVHISEFPSGVIK